MKVEKRESIKKISLANQAQIIEWLLQGGPWVQYRTLTDILEKDKNDNDVIAAKVAISKHRLIKRIFDKQNIDGYWGTAKDIYTWWPKKDTTFWLLGMLADFGFTKENKKIASACEYVLSTQQPCGGFSCAPLPTPAYDCFTGILTRSLARLGYVDDPRVRKAYKWLIKRQRHDGGFWCKNTGQPGRHRERESSCAFATLCVLDALAQSFELKKGKVAKRSVEFLLQCWENRGKIKYAGHDSQIGRGWEKLKYPFTDYKILKYLDVLSQFQFARTDSRIIEMMNVLISKQDIHGRFTPESIHKIWSNFDFGQKKSPSRWITLIVYLIVKRMLFS